MFTKDQMNAVTCPVNVEVEFSSDELVEFSIWRKAMRGGFQCQFKSDALTIKMLNLLMKLKYSVTWDDKREYWTISWGG